MKNKQNKYLVINYLQVNFPKICESETIQQDELMCFFNNTFFGIKFSIIDKHFI